MPDTPDQSGNKPALENSLDTPPLDVDSGQKEDSTKSGNGLPPFISSDGKLHVLPHRVSRRLRLPKDVEVIDPRFRRYTHSYLVQAFLATLAMLLILLFVDSLADAALAAGLASSVVILFLHPSASSAKVRSVVGGHSLALLIGIVCSLLIFHSPGGQTIAQGHILSDIGVAVSLGAVILLMALTNTEHPPAAGTVLGIAIQTIDPMRVVVFIGAIILLALIHFMLRSRLHDLI